MVVNGGCFHNLIIPYNKHVDLTSYPNMAGKAVLLFKTNSHPFVDRTLSLEQPVKIGRSVARARAAQSNGIFDCKVLSRNHALIWYNNGKFYLQDTKSSNGTFVNNQRLSKSGEESLPREVSSGDIVQFGHDVLENASKVTHGCIVANLKLYLPDGKEAKASPSSSVLSGVGSVSVEELYQLNQLVQQLGVIPDKEQLSNAGVTCPICHDEYEKPVLLSCQHVFCESCVARWFENEQTCPLCRAKVVDDPSWRDGSTTYFIF